MRVMTISELLQLIRIELCNLAAWTTNRVPDYPDGLEAAVNARITLSNIRRVLASRSSEPV